MFKIVYFFIGVCMAAAVVASPQAEIAILEAQRVGLAQQLQNVDSKILKNASELFQKNSPRHFFINKDGTFTPGLIKLLKLSNLYDEKDTLQDVVTKTQKAWIAVQQGAQNKERSDLQDSAEQQKTAAEVVQTAKEMGLFNARAPQLHRYTYGVVLGAFLNGVRERVAELAKAWEAGIRFDEVVILTGERPLRKGDGENDDLKKLCDEKLSPLPFKKDWKLPDNAVYEYETDMARLVLDQVQLPEGMAKSCTFTVVNAPRGKNLRPSTKDTYDTWIKEHNPKPGTIVATSTPLLCNYQQLTGENVLQGRMPLDTIGGPVTKELLQQHGNRIVSLIHDTAAKCLFEINKQESK
jgi:hypothetical protein